MARILFFAFAIFALAQRAQVLAADDGGFVLAREIDRRFPDPGSQAAAVHDCILEFAFPLSRDVASRTDDRSREWMIKSQEQRQARVYAHSLASDVAMRFSDEGAATYR